MFATAPNRQAGHMTRRPPFALAALVATFALTSTAQAAEPSVAPSEARTVTKQALAQTAALIDAKKVVVPSCEIHGARARCRAIIRGPRQTLRATVAIRELPDDYVVRVLRIG
jgi:hypothetical protein